MNIFGHAGGIDLFLQLVKLTFFAAAQFLLDGLDLFVQVILFLRLLHLPLHPRLDGPVYIQLLDFDIQHVGDPRQALRGIENLQQFLLLFNGQLQVGRDHIRQLGRIFHPHRGNHRLVVQCLAELHILLEQRGHALHGRFQRGIRLVRKPRHPHRRLHKAFSIDHLQDLAALNAFHQHLDIAVRQLQALHNVYDRAHLVNLICLRLVDRCVVLRRQKYLLIRCQGLFQSAHAGFAAHHERGHHEREDDDVANRHHGQLSGFVFFFRSGH